MFAILRETQAGSIHPPVVRKLKKTALEDAITIAGNGWQVWVEDEQGNTIFDNRKEEE